jgi:hypothetical protein
VKTLTLHVDDQVFADLEEGLRKKRIVGQFGGTIDMSALAIVEAIKANQTERTLRYRKKVDIINAVGK